MSKHNYVQFWLLCWQIHSHQQLLVPKNCFCWLQSWSWTWSWWLQVIIQQWRIEGSHKSPYRDKHSDIKNKISSSYKNYKKSCTNLQNEENVNVNIFWFDWSAVCTSWCSLLVCLKKKWPFCWNVIHYSLWQLGEIIMNEPWCYVLKLIHEKLQALCLAVMKSENTAAGEHKTINHPAKTNAVSYWGSPYSFKSMCHWISDYNWGIFLTGHMNRNWKSIKIYESNTTMSPLSFTGPILCYTYSSFSTSVTLVFILME